MSTSEQQPLGAEAIGIVNALRDSFATEREIIKSFKTLNLPQLLQLKLIGNSLMTPDTGTDAEHALVEARSYFEAFAHILRLPKTDATNQSQKFIAGEVEDIFGHERFSPSERLKLAVIYGEVLDAYSEYMGVSETDNTTVSSGSKQEFESMGLFQLLGTPSEEGANRLDEWFAQLSSTSYLDDRMAPYRDRFLTYADGRIATARTVRDLSGGSLGNVVNDDNVLERMREEIFQAYRHGTYTEITRLLKQNFRPTQLPLLLFKYPNLMYTYIAYSDMHQ